MSSSRSLRGVTPLLAAALAAGILGCSVDANENGAAAETTDAVIIDESGDGGTFQVAEGQLVVVRLQANPMAGYRWIVAAVDRSFGSPVSDEMELATPPDGAMGQGGTQTLTWLTTGFLPLVGEHAVTLEYRRIGEDDVPALRTFAFTVDIVSADAPADSIVIDESGEGQTFTAVEGQLVVVRLQANPMAGYRWIVTAVDRSFGSPVSDEMELATPPDGAMGQGGTQILTWQTTGFLPLVGEHAVTLEYRRIGEDDVPALRTFAFTVDITSATAGE